jgi:Fur family transcriptional regulator, ferric uptake regulator
VTRPRQIVWEVLAASDRHLSAQEIAERAQHVDPRINVSSVYRTLTLFTEINLVHESRLGDDASTWEIAHGHSYIHLVCDGCGTVQHHDARIVETLRHELDLAAGFCADIIDARGLCRTCGEGRHGLRRPGL